MLTKKHLIDGFKKLGLKENDIVIVHSSFKSFGPVEGGPQTVIDAILHILGNNGTLVMPTYTLSFCNQANKTGLGIFDVQNSPSEMGILTEFLRKMPNSIRTSHPIHSVTAIGKYAKRIEQIDEKSSFGAKSIFNLLHQLNAKMIIIGLSYDASLTFFHYIEQTISVPYRYIKQFPGKIIFNKNNEYEDTFSMYVKNLEKNVRTNYDKLGAFLEQNNAVKIHKIGESTVKIMKSKDVFSIVSEELKRNPEIVYWIDEGN